MKNLLLLFLFISSPLFAQGKDTTWVYIDSIQFDYSKVFINPDNVKSVRTEQNPGDTLYTSHQTGVLHIERKRHNKLICLKDFIDNSESLKNEPTVNIIVNGNFIENPNEYFIEEEAIKNLEILINNPSQKNSHLWRIPTLIITTK